MICRWGWGAFKWHLMGSSKKKENPGKQLSYSFTWEGIAVTRGEVTETQGTLHRHSWTSHCQDGLGSWKVGISNCVLPWIPPVARRNRKGQHFQVKRDILLTFHLVGENKVKHFGFVPVQNSRVFLVSEKRWKICHPLGSRNNSSSSSIFPVGCTSPLTLLLTVLKKEAKKQNLNHLKSLIKHDQCRIIHSALTDKSTEHCFVAVHFHQ